MSNTDLELMLRGYSLATAEILYRMPDHPNILQTFLWQEYDLFPKFPRLKKFLGFWVKNIDGPLHSVQIAHQKLIKPTEFRHINHEFVIQ